MMIAVAGGSGSGKSTIVQMIKSKCDDLDILVFEQDHYYRDLSQLSVVERAQQNFDHPEAIDHKLMTSHLLELASGNAVERPTYDFASHTVTGERVVLQPAPVIIFDGIFALYYDNIRPLYDLKIYVDIEDDIRLVRRLLRDVEQRGRSMAGVVDQYLKSVAPMHKAYIAPTKAQADLIVRWETRNEAIVNHLARMIKGRVHDERTS